MCLLVCNVYLKRNLKKIVFMIYNQSGFGEKKTLGSALIPTTLNTKKNS